MTFDIFHLRDPTITSRRGWAIRRLADGKIYLFGFSSRSAAETFLPHLRSSAPFWITDPKLVIFSLSSQLKASA